MSDMLTIRGRVSQVGVDQMSVFQIDTGLGVLDQKTLWELVGMDVQWSNAWIQPAKAQYIVNAVLTRDETKFQFLDQAVIGQLDWTVGGGAGLTDVQALPQQMIKRLEFPDEPLVANSRFYMICQTASTGQANELQFKLYYREKKVSEVEFLKAQSAYCIC